MAAINNGERWITSAGRLSNFSLKETECRCGCGHNPIHQTLIDLLQEIRDTLGAPININCAARCETHNAKVGGVKNSFHVQGMAADIAIKDDYSGGDKPSEALYEDMKYIEIPCIIKYPGRYFCHIDIRQTDKPIRLAEQNGTYIPIDFGV
jgi:hypothetical protein